VIHYGRCRVIRSAIRRAMSAISCAIRRHCFSQAPKSSESSRANGFIRFLCASFAASRTTTNTSPSRGRKNK
jgi:hypothetical protein